MSEKERQGNLDPAEFSVDDQGRLIIDNPILSAAIRKLLSSRRGAAQVANRSTEAGVNIIACGNHCTSIE
jgi:hypothetical protein